MMEGNVAGGPRAALAGRLTADEISREPQVVSALALLMSQIDELETEVHRVADRLQMAMRPELEQVRREAENRAQPVPREPRAPLAATLEAACDRLCMVNAALHSIRGRLEV